MSPTAWPWHVRRWTGAADGERSGAAHRDRGRHLGTDAAAVAEAITAADDDEGVVVIMDLGSALLSAELALELLSKPTNQVRLVTAAFVEGIFAAVI